MLKRTKGYLLLTMLVLTGMAGKLHTETLTGKERRLLVQELKISKQAIKETIPSLTAEQLNFRPRKNELSAADCILRLATMDDYIWSKTRQALKQPATSLQLKGNDHRLVEIAGQPLEKLLPDVSAASFPDTEKAFSTLWSNRASQLKYARTTTGNVRAYSAQLGNRSFDVYQLLLLNCAYTQYYIGKIRELKSHPRFPQ